MFVLVLKAKLLYELDFLSIIFFLVFQVKKKEKKLQPWLTEWVSEEHPIL